MDVAPVSALGAGFVAGSVASAIALVGVGLNAWVGWWWADPLAALVMVPIIAREGRDGLRGRACGHDGAY